MDLVLNEEQELLARTAREFVSGRSSLRRIRQLRDNNDADGFSRDLWREMAALGWLGIVIPEEYGGAGLGYLDQMVVIEEMGRGLMPEPFLSTVLLGATALLRVAEASIQIMGKGGQRQVPEVKNALATGFGGCFWSDVVILSAERP